MATRARAPKVAKKARRSSAEVAANKLKAEEAKLRWTVDKAEMLDELERICAVGCVVDCESSGKRYMMGDTPTPRELKAGLALGQFKPEEEPDPSAPFGDQITELAAVSIHDGRLLFSKLVRPAVRYQGRAWEIAQEAGVTREELDAAEEFPVVFEEFLSAIAGYIPFAWNAAFDTRLFEQSCAQHGWTRAATRQIFPGFTKTGEGTIGHETYPVGVSRYAYRYGIHCHDAMKPYGLLVGRGHYTKLADAAAEQGIAFEGQAHRAAEDCRVTAAVLRSLRDRLLKGEPAR